MFTKANINQINEIAKKNLEEYNQDLSSRTFVELINDEYAELSYKNDSATGGMSPILNTIKYALNKFERDEKGFFKVTDEFENFVENLNPALQELFIKNNKYRNGNSLSRDYAANMEKYMDDSELNRIKAMGIYMAAKNKVASRSFIDKLFHPFRTYRESKMLDNLKDNICETYNINKLTFDRSVAWASNKKGYDKVGLIADNGNVYKDGESYDDKEDLTPDDRYELDHGYSDYDNKQYIRQENIHRLETLIDEELDGEIENLIDDKMDEEQKAAFDLLSEEEIGSIEDIDAINNSSDGSIEIKRIEINLGKEGLENIELENNSDLEDFVNPFYEDRLPMNIQLDDGTLPLQNQVELVEINQIETNIKTEINLPTDKSV